MVSGFRPGVWMRSVTGGGGLDGVVGGVWRLPGLAVCFVDLSRGHGDASMGLERHGEHISITGVMKSVYWMCCRKNTSNSSIILTS